MVATMFIVWVVGTVGSIGIVAALLKVLYRTETQNETDDNMDI